MIVCTPHQDDEGDREVCLPAVHLVVEGAVRVSGVLVEHEVDDPGRDRQQPGDRVADQRSVGRPVLSQGPAHHHDCGDRDDEQHQRDDEEKRPEASADRLCVALDQCVVGDLLRRRLRRLAPDRLREAALVRVQCQHQRHDHQEQTGEVQGRVLPPRHPPHRDHCETDDQQGTDENRPACSSTR